jgi:hypothetical protein
MSADPLYVPPPPHTFDDQGFTLPPFREHEWTTWTVGVCGGLHYGTEDARWVRGKVYHLLGGQLARGNVGIQLAPTPGACRIVYDWFRDRGRVHLGWLGRAVWGRAAEFRAALDLVQVAEALVVFEPLDLIARYAVRLAGMAPGKVNGAAGAGITVKVVRPRG